MGFLKNILAALGLVVVVAVFIGYSKFGGMISQVKQLDSQAIPTYMAMFTKVLETGDAAKGMVLHYKVNEDVASEDVVESIKALAEEYNMRVTGDTKMFTMDDATGTEVKSVRNISMCSLPIAKKFISYSHDFGGFMPCRIMLIELANGERYLYTMDLTLAIHGGRPLSAEMLKLATHVQTAMLQIPQRAAKGDF
jgi:uncharacterized protein (DUF302 family)